MIGQYRNCPWIKPFVRSPEEVAKIIELVLDGKMHCHPWDDFICIWIKGAPDMDSIRAACEELEPFEKIGDDGMVSFSPDSRLKLQEMLDKLRSISSGTP